MAKILIVEDEKILAEILAKGFKLLGHSVIIANDGESAIRLTKSNPDIKLILLDLMIPLKDGFQVLEELKQDESTKEIPVVITSNIAEEGKIREGLLGGAQEYLVKSNISMDDLTAIANKYIG